MASSSLTRIEKFTSEEKSRIALALQKGFFIKGIIYSLIIGSSVFILVYYNFFTAGFENIWLLNLAIGISAAICVRICFLEIRDYLREVNSTAKKVIDTRIVSREGKKITIGNQQFKREDILLDAPEFDNLQAGDHVRVEHSAKSHTLFRVKKI